jgi:hypothetical protein
MRKQLKFALGLMSFLFTNTLLFGLAVAGLTKARGFETAFYISFVIVIIQGIGLYFFLTNRP